MIQVIFDNLFCRVTRPLPASQKVSKKYQIAATLNKINPACLHCNSDKFCPFLTIMTCLSQSIHCFFDEFWSYFIWSNYTDVYWNIRFYVSMIVVVFWVGENRFQKWINCLHCMCIILGDKDATAEDNKLSDPVPSANVKVIIHLIHWVLDLIYH